MAASDRLAAQRLAGQVALITGAGSGVGRAMVDRFQAEGAHVIGVDVDQGRVDRLVEETGVQGCRADVSDQADIDRLVGLYGDSVSILCNNAGVIGQLSLIHEATLEDYSRVMAVNLTGPFMLCRGFIPPMLESGSGTIVNTASVGGLRGGRAGAAYTASKFGLVGLTANIAATLGDKGIRCNAICPGSVNTNIGTNAQVSDAYMEILTRAMPMMPPPAAPEQIAAVAAFLASDDASYVNGAAFPVDAGWTAQ